MPDPMLRERLVAALESSCAGLIAVETVGARAARLAHELLAANRELACELLPDQRQLARELLATQRQLAQAAEQLRAAIAALRAADERALSAEALGFVVDIADTAGELTISGESRRRGSEPQASPRRTA